MDAGGKSKAKNAGTESKGNKRKQYLPHNKPVKKKGYPLRPGVQGFFITCDGGRERQASREAVNVIDSFYEELLHGNETKETTAEQLAQPANTKIKFRYSESSSGEEEEDNDDDDDDDDGSSEEEENGEESRSNTSLEKNADPQNMINKMTDPQKNDEEKSRERLAEAAANVDKNDNVPKDQGKEVVEPPMKKQCLEKDLSKAAVVAEKEEKSVDKLIEAELEELADKNKRHFVSLDSGCNGVVFVQMRRRDGEPGPREIVQHMMTTAASTRKHMSRFILRVLPIEVSCYASEEEISRAIKPLVAQYFPIETETPQKFAVLYDGRANSGIDRMKIINSVAKSIPAPHKVDLNNPDKSIVVQIVKTVCLIGLVEKYKELGKYNLRQLTSSKS